MNPNKFQIITIGAVLGIAILFFLIFKGVLPGLQKDNKAAKNAVQGTLVIWGMYDDGDALKPAFAAFKARYPKLEISYKKFTDPLRYEAELLEALAVRKGPDIFMIPNGALERNKEKIAFAPQSQMSLLSLRRFFPRVVEEDFFLEGRVGALPRSIDTLALLYNRSALNEAGVALPPETWEELEAMIPRLVKKDGAGNLTRAGAALGGSGDTIARAEDILKLIAFQHAAAEGTSLGAATQGSAGTRALDFYAKFGRAGDVVSTWNETMPYSLDAFGAGRVAMIFGYFTDMKNVSAR
ncbi:MAG: extracellular solute-binding protein, partial [Patescibacteria group bacterium]